jgi:hypothetical protein
MIDRQIGYTPSPWRVEVKGRHHNNPELVRCDIVHGDSNESIADTVYEIDDAYLIAAAPMMREFIATVRATLPWMGGNGETTYELMRVADKILEATPQKTDGDRVTTHLGKVVTDGY